MASQSTASQMAEIVDIVTASQLFAICMESSDLDEYARIDEYEDEVIFKDGSSIARDLGEDSCLDFFDSDGDYLTTAVYNLH